MLNSVGTENSVGRCLLSVVRSLLSVPQGRKIVSIRTECPCGTDNYNSFPALFSVLKGRKVTLSQLAGKEIVKRPTSE